MAQEPQLAHRVLSNTALPFVTNVSPSSTDPHYVAGSLDFLTSAKGYLERRPGWSDAVEPTPTVFNSLQRLFTWDRTDGTFIVMACQINVSNQAQVYKMVVGTDNSFVSIWTDTVSPNIYDFVVSNNTVYFSNGVFAKKWDPVNGISNWGIAINAVNSAPTVAGAGATVSIGNTVWTNPGNVTSAVSYATSTIPTDLLQATTFGFALGGGSTILGITVQADFVTGNQSPLAPQLVMQLLKNGSLAGTPINTMVGANSNGVVAVGGAANLWGTTWLPNDVNQTGFGVAISFVGAAGLTTSIRNVRIVISSITGPTIAVSGGAGSMNATAGYTYVYCYGNSRTGHISSPSPASVSTGVFTNKASVSVTLVASTDPQVNQIHVFRTTDGGGGTYFELPTSPYPNSSGAITDSALDSALIVSSIAPTPNFNDPPTPGQSAVYFAGRIWMFNGGKVYFSGLEEINQGVPEECFPSGIAGNFFAYDEPVTACSVSGTAAGGNQVQLTFCGGRVYGIFGTTLDTFQRFEVSRRRGCRNLETVTVMGGMCAWLDSSNQVWATDGNSLQELSRDIRPTLQGLNPLLCSMSFHAAGQYHWLALNTGTQTLVYDIDMQQWMPPWSVACNYLYSGEISPGNYVLMMAKATKALQLNTSAFNDNGVTYQPIIVTQLLSTIPDFGSRFSYVAVGSYNEPTRTGYPTCFGILNNGNAVSDVLMLNDDDPTQSFLFTNSIAANIQTPATTFKRNQGTRLKQLIYPLISPACRWASFRIVLPFADQVDNIYELFMSYKGAGGM